ncbi:hypothetical protein QAD02_003610 [Eretmocerus hayati]|uniref:Uncharacterized protein n=1 Tax=Eretmocerus hayati TaxID=131215 RepID=A0ACC2NMK4_9HYME|nr:hypothetical protein QAD02_003610 [Eretmocerus hayati]
MSASMSVPASARNDLHDISIKDCVLIRPYDAVHGVLGEMRIGYSGFLGAADRRDKARLKEVIRDDVAVPMAWPVAVSVDSSSKKLRPMLMKAQFDEILVKIYKHGDWTKCKKAMTNFENYGIYTPTREQRSQLKRKGDEDFVTQTDDDFDSEYDEEPEKTSRKRRRGMLPSEKVNLTAADKELADIILRGNNGSDVEEDEDKENEHCGNDGTPRTSRPGTPGVDLHQPEEIDNTEGSGRNTPEDRVPLLDNRHGEDALPPTAVEVPQGSKESKRMKIARLEEENEN